MAKARSPNYPALSLRETIEAVSLVYRADHLNKMDAKTAALHMGHKTLNGRALVKVSALRKFGLLQGQGSQLQVTNDAVAIIADPIESEDRRAAITRAAFNPPLFAELRNQFPAAVPSHANLKSYLMKRGFTEDAALTAGEKYLETFELVTDEGGEYNAGKSEEGINPPKEPPMPETGISNPPFSPKTLHKPQSGIAEDRFTLEEGVAMMQWPEHLTKESFEDFQSWVQLVLRKAKRAIRDADGGVDDTIED